nr:MAG TPA: hypothetical protein [Caudoviricetes sp.]
MLSFFIGNNFVFQKEIVRSRLKRYLIQGY